MLQKLHPYGIRGNFLRILEDSLSNRREVVKYNDFYSDYYDVISGVPQGGVLSPLLFILYISDLQNCVISKTFCFADDILVLRPIHCKNDCEILQEDINEIYNYCKQNFLKINCQKLNT